MGQTTLIADENGASDDPGAPFVVFVGGPTASGKSACALEIAERAGGEIVNADASQVYRDLSVLTARPGPDELARAPHHLFGHMDASERCSAGAWARAAADVVNDIVGRGRVAIVAGGTGLYFRALEGGLSDMPEIPDSARAAATRRHDEIGPQAFYDEVCARDPAMTRLHPNDHQRLIRAWEVFEATGAALSDFQGAPGAPLTPAPVAKVVIAPDREALYAACEARFDAMIASGAIDEVARLCARGLASDLPAMKALGVPELVSYLDGALPLDEAVELAKRNTRRFAKRQMTWFRGQAGDWLRAADAGEAVRTVAKAVGGPDLFEKRD